MKLSVKKINSSKSNKMFKQNHGRTYFKNLYEHQFFGDYTRAIHEDILNKSEGREDEIYPASDCSY